MARTAGGRGSCRAARAMYAGSPGGSPSLASATLAGHPVGWTGGTSRAVAGYKRDRGRFREASWMLDAPKMAPLAGPEEGKMKERETRAGLVDVRDQQWDSLRALIRGLEEERDLQGLAAVAEMSLMGLRQLCERPVTCEELDRQLESLRQLKLDEFEAGEEL